MKTKLRLLLFIMPLATAIVSASIFDFEKGLLIVSGLLTLWLVGVILDAASSVLEDKLKERKLLGTITVKQK